jgi:signal transduction histidine kinase/serine phosphatase RsbU (regulator of sigma subunit)
MLKRFKNNILEPYLDSSYVTRQKAFILFWTFTFSIPILAAILLLNIAKSSTEDKNVLIAVDIIFILADFLCLFFLRKGMLNAAGISMTIIGTSLFLVSSVWRFDDFVKSGANGFSYFFFAAMIFSSLFTNRRFFVALSVFLIVFNCSEFIIVFIAQGAISIKYYDHFINSNLSMMLFFLISYFTLVVTDRALSRTEIELEKNKNLNINLERIVTERTTELLLANERLTESNEKLKEIDVLKSAFFANVSHEIRTPLTLILSPIESVLQDDYYGEIDRNFFMSIHRNAVHLLNLINNILDFSKIEAGGMTLDVRNIDICLFVRRIVTSVESAAELKGIGLSAEIPDYRIMLYADTEKLSQSILNLLMNAIKFTDRGGRITVRIIPMGTECSIVISDTGIGIPCTKLESIFDRFVQADEGITRKYGGTGLGLALAREFVEMHGGRITVESSYVKESPESHGSLFAITMPRGKEHLASFENVRFMGDMPSEETEHELGNLSLASLDSNLGFIEHDSGEEFGLAMHNDDSRIVLVVEDNRDMREFMLRILRKHYRVYTATNGQEGLNRAREIMPDCIITDIMMPVMNGFEMTKALKNDPEFKIVPVIMLSAKSEISDKVDGLDCGADDYLTKPFNSRELMARVRSMVKAYLYEKEVIDRNAEIEKELEIAKLIQERLLPSCLPDVTGLRMHAVYMPMDKVGGDFYDCRITDGKFCFIMADVSGHGLASSYISLIAKMAFEGLANVTDPAKAMQEINAVLYRSCVMNNFVTAFMGVLDIKTKELSYCSAGHYPPLIYRPGNDAFIELEAQGRPLGWFEKVQLYVNTIRLLYNDRLVVFTDGVVESHCDGMELFGDERMRDIIRTAKSSSPEVFIDLLMFAVYRHLNGKPHNDDITILVMDVINTSS